MNAAPEQAAAQRFTVQNLLLQGELLKILSALDGANIPCIVLKGIPLAKRLKVTLNERRILDNDLLLHREDVPRAVQVLAELGYAPRPFSELEVDLKWWFQHILCARRHQQSVIVEVHWQAFSPTLFQVDEGLAWQHTKIVELDGRPVQVFDDALTLIHLAAHYLQHSFHEARILRDVARAWNAFGKELNLGELRELARKTDCLLALEFALATAAELGLIAENPLTPSSRVKLVQRLLSNQNLAEDSGKRDYSRTLPSLLLGNPVSVASWLKRAVLPPLELMPLLYKEEKSWRLYARYLSRPLRPLARALGARLDEQAR
ncbi:MAG: nucleotidyltransferase family protein [Polyangiaceae bacterium]|nr:nucleotidyltransferase family protein [Polyangiaceae bacterium]